MNTQQSITWLFRKKRDLANFSIEQSFAEVRAAWPAQRKPPVTGVLFGRSVWFRTTYFRLVQPD